MKVERKRWEDVTILSFVGEFDAFNLPTFSQKIDSLVEQGECKMVFNLRLLTFINSSALGYLLKVKKRCQELGGDLTLVSPSKFIKKTLLTLGLQEVFGIYETDEDGVLSFQRPQGAKKAKISGEESGKDEKLTGANAIMFQVVDEEGKSLYGSSGRGSGPVQAGQLGTTHLVGHITNLTESTLEFRFDVPPAGPKHLVPIHQENFESAVHPGTRLHVKFRQPFAMKSYYFEITALVLGVSKGEGDNPHRASVSIEFREMKPEDRQAIGDFVRDLRKFREILGKGGDAV
jgi:anti-anti-sigma factor